VGTLVCIVYYRDADVEIRSREEWLRAPSKGVQLLACRSDLIGRYLDDATGGPRPNEWGAYGFGWYVWWPGEAVPWGADPDGLRDYLTEMGVMTDAMSLADLTFDEIAAAGAKQGRSVDTQLFNEIVARAMADPRLPAPGPRGAPRG
jgi:hypothetical protein